MGCSVSKCRTLEADESKTERKKKKEEEEEGAASLAAVWSVTDLTRPCLVLVSPNKSRSHNSEFVTAYSPIHRYETTCQSPRTLDAFRNAFIIKGPEFKQRAGSWWEKKKHPFDEILSIHIVLPVLCAYEGLENDIGGPPPLRWFIIVMRTKHTQGFSGRPGCSC